MRTSIEREQGADPTPLDRFDRRNAEARTGQWLLEVDRAWLALRRGSPDPEAIRTPEQGTQGDQTESTSAYAVQESETARQASTYGMEYGIGAQADRADAPGQQAIAASASLPSASSLQSALGSGGSNPTLAATSPALPGATALGGGSVAFPAGQGMPADSAASPRPAGIADRGGATRSGPGHVAGSMAERARDSVTTASYSIRSAAMNPVSAVIPAPSLILSSTALNKAHDPSIVIPSIGDGATAEDAEPTPGSNPAGRPTASGEAYSSRHVHVQLDDDGIHAYLRDASLDQTDVFAVAQAIYEQTMLDHGGLASVTVNGTPIPRTPRPGRIESATTNSSAGDDEASLATEFRAQRSSAL